jgi:hypothetical protein
MLPIVVLAFVLASASFTNSPAQAQVGPFGPGTASRICEPQYLPSCPPGRRLTCLVDIPCASIFVTGAASMCEQWACLYDPRRIPRRLRRR